MCDPAAVEHQPVRCFDAGLVTDGQGQQDRAIALVVQIWPHGGAHRMPGPLSNDGQACPGFVVQVFGLAAHTAQCPYAMCKGVGLVIEGLWIARAMRRLERQCHAPYLAGDQFRKRSEEHTSELQSLMRISYAVFCLKKKTTTNIL